MTTLSGTVNGFDPITELTHLLEDERERVVRLWAKRLRADLHEVQIPGRDVRAPLAELLDELTRLLESRGEDALRLWPEYVRPHGARRYDQHFEADDLTREFVALELALFKVAAKRFGDVPIGLASLIAEVSGEGLAAAEAGYARVLRTEEVRFKEAAVMESVLHHVDVGILLAELDGTLSFATPPVSRILGVPMRALVGARASQSLVPVLTQLNARHLDGRPFRIADMPFARALKERRPIRNVQMTFDRSAGDQVIIEMSATPIWEEEASGQMYGVIQTITDRTERAQKTRELAEAYEELRALQGKLLQRTRTQALGQLASGAAHALNNFLNVLRLRITLLRREFKPEHLDALDKTVRNIGDLVARLQEFSVQRTEETLKDVGFDQLVTEALELTRSELSNPEHPLEVEAELHAEGQVRVDAGFFRELLVNLLLAARDRMSAGGTLRLQSKREGDWLAVELKDAGPRYSEEELARLFDPLKGKSATPQLSLLLAVSRNQVQRWGGELACENNPNGEPGATFRLKLPLAQAEATVRPAPPRAPPRRFQRTRRVLVVDDDPDNARMMAEVLTDEGYQVQLANSGAEALAGWGDGSFDAVLLDAQMPGMSGLGARPRAAVSSPADPPRDGHRRRRPRPEPQQPRARRRRLPQAGRRERARRVPEPDRGGRRGEASPRAKRKRAAMARTDG